MLSSTFLGIVPIIFGLVSTPVKDTPRHDVYNGGGIYGSYCMRDTYEDDFVGLEDDYLYCKIYLLSDYDNADYQPMIMLDNDATLSYYIYDMHVNVYSYGDDTYWDVDIGYNNVRGGSQASYNLTYRVYQGEDITDIGNEHEDLIIYFPNTIAVDNTILNAFRSVFTGEGNRFVHYYNGFYTFIDTDYNASWLIYGAISINNELFNNMYYDNGYSVGNQSFKNYNLKYIWSGAFVNSEYQSPNVYLGNCLISNTMYSRMSDMGVFGYVSAPNNVTFAGMVTSVIDAPIYMLSQLFSFELFGVQFYIAFMSIVTVVLICFLIKKLI